MIPISDLGLSGRSYNALVSNEIYYLTDLAKIEPSELWKMANIGKAVTAELSVKLSAFVLKGEE